jgi:hypothetical protein
LRQRLNTDSTNHASQIRLDSYLRIQAADHKGCFCSTLD